MYKEIDELIEAIVHNDIFIEYHKAEKMLHEDKLILLLSRHQALHEDYLRIKQLENYISIKEVKEELIEIKKEVTSHPVIQNYYRRYYDMNELLDEVTSCVFDGISHQLNFDSFTL